MAFYIFDVETEALPVEQIIGLAPEFSAPANWKDPAKIEADIERKRAEWLQDAALSPLTGQVVAVGFQRTGQRATLKLEGVEPRILQFFWQEYNRITAEDFSAKFVGFYSNRFDIPFLLRRSWKLGVAVPEFVLTGTYPCDRFIDLARYWEMGNREDRISLDRLARFLGVGSKEKNGADFGELLRTDPAKAEEYLRNDLNITEACAGKMGVIPRLTQLQSA